MNAIPEWQNKFKKTLPRDNIEPWDERFKKPPFQELFKKPSKETLKKLEQDSAEFYQAKAGFLGAATRFAKDTMNNDIIRMSYQQNVERVLAEVEQMIKNNKITHEEGTRFCSSMRNKLMDMHREYTSKFGLAQAIKYKKEGRSFEYLQQRYSTKRYKTDFDSLSTEKQNQVFEDIMKASARPDKDFTIKVKRLQLLGRVTLVASGVLAAYEIINADNKLKEAMKQGIGIGGGIAGGAAAGLMVDPLCGPAAPACALVTVSLGAFIGGIYGAFTADMLDDELEELTKWISP